MSVLDKRQLIEDLSGRLGSIVTVDQLEKIRTEAEIVLERFDVVSREDAGEDAEDLIRMFLDAKASEGMSRKTIERYRYLLKRLQENMKVPMGRVTVHHLRRYITSEMERGIKPSTMEGARSCWSSFFGWCAREELIKKNPCANLSTIKTPKEIRLPYSSQELARLNDAVIKSPRNAALISFLSSTGCRVSEVCGTNIEDVDFRTKSVRVLGKGAKERTAYIDDVCEMRIKSYLGDRSDTEPALFVNRYGERLNPGGVRTILNGIGEAAHVDNVHPHRFRRTLATQLIDRGMGIQEVAAILGHAKIDTTMTYIYIDHRKVEADYRRYA